ASGGAAGRHDAVRRGGPGDPVLREICPGRRRRPPSAPAGNPGQREARALPEKPPRWSAARRASPFKRRREAPKQGACVPVMAREPGASQHPERLWRSPPPRGVEMWKRSQPARCAGREEKEENEGGDRETNRRLGRAAQISLRNLRKLDCVARPNTPGGRATLGLARSARSTQPTHGATAAPYSPGCLTS